MMAALQNHLAHRAGTDSQGRLVIVHCALGRRPPPPPRSAGGDWSCLPRHGGDVQWDMPICAASRCTVSKAATGSQGRWRRAKESTFFGCVPHCRAEGVLPVHRVTRKACPDAMATGVKSRQLTSTEAKFKKMLGEKAYHSRGGRTAGGTVASCATQGD
jgi:hypothetical protein